MSSFFLPSKTKSGALGKRRKRLSQVKKKRDSKASNKKIPLADSIPSDEDEDIPSDSDTENKDYQSLNIDEDVSDREETVPEKRLRLAKDYLQQLKAQERGSSTDDEDDDDDDVDNDAIGRRLQEKALERSGRIHKTIADQYIAPPLESIRFYRGHKLSVTSLALTPDDRYAFTGSKDSSIIKWNVEKGVKEIMIARGKEGVTGHTGHVLALAVSTDGMYLASGGTDNVIHIWNPLTCIHLHTFRGHKSSVTGLVFQQGANQLFSSSLDRTVKVWNISEMTYVETLFGHQDGIISIDCLSQERPITAGVDKTLRVWKIIEESHLVYHGHKSSIDTVKMINDKNFVSGSQDGVALWNNSKKKPQVLKSSSHEAADVWITAVTALPYSDLVASGSRDGYIHFWKCGENFRTLEKLFNIPLPGFINSLSFSRDGQYLAVGVGQEHRLGRWWKETSTKNGIAFIPLNVKNKN